MSALSYYLERAGLMTTAISLVRENTESMQPPRALWVSFPLGRPLGKAGDAGFQLNVIRSALALLRRASGPVLEDYPHDAPHITTAEAAPACPVSFARTQADDSWQQRLTLEFETLRPWYEMSLRRRAGRTLVGISEHSPQENVERLGRQLDQGGMPRDIVWLKRAVEDLKAYYTEALTAQPGEHSAAAVQARFWQETQLGAAILRLYQQFQNADNNRLKIVARMLAPREAVGEATGPA